ncbi:MAG: SNF2-related protein [Propionibacteriaceae bacterium]
MTASIDPVLAITPALLSVTFGHAAVAAGEVYAAEGKVESLMAASSGEATVVQASVVGSQRRRYETVVTVRPGGGVTSRCTCPARINCKHGAATALAARSRRRPAAATWRRTLEDLTEAVRRAPSHLIPLGLLVDDHYGVLSMLPVQHSARGKWVKTGATWDDVRDAWKSGWDERQRSSLDNLGRLRFSTGNFYGYGNQPAPLAAFGPHLWSALRRVVESGVEIVRGRDLPPVRILDEPVEVVTHVAKGSGGLEVISAIHADGQNWARRQVTFVGGPAHGVVLQSEDELILGEFTDPLSPAQEKLATRNQHIDVPTADTTQFLAAFLAPLQRTVRVVVDDGVEVPVVHAPVATLEVTYAPGHITDLAWGFRYRVGDEQIDVGVAGDVSPVRDVAAEEELLGLLPRQPWGVIEDGFAPPHLVPHARLTGTESAVFATNWLPALESSDRVVVTLVGDRPDYRYSDVAPTVRLAVTDPKDGAGDWFNLDVQVSIDGEEVDFAELFAALARGETRLVLAGGTWFSLERPELDQLRAVIAEATLLAGGSSELRLRAEHAGLWEDLVALGVVAQQSAAWQRAVSGLLDLTELPEVPIPDGLTATLRPYQVVGYRWLTFLWQTRLGGILADDMGLGKTVQLLAAILHARAEDPESPPVLVVAPTSVVPTWADQARMFAPGLRLEVVARTSAKRAEILSDVGVRADIVVTSYTLLRLDEEEYGAHPWSAVIFDEAQFVKNRSAATYKAARRLRARVKFAVTGTPMENNLMDLWSMLSIATPGLFPSPDAFTEGYRKPIENDGANEVLARLRRRVRPVLMRRTKEEVATELPPKQEQVLSIPLSAGHRRLYDRHLAAVRKQVLGLVGDMDRNRVAILQSLTRLRQLSLSPALVEPGQPPVSAKIDALVEMLGDMTAEGHRALIFSQFTSFLALVKARLDAEKITYVYLDGRTRNREQRIDSFKKGTDPVFLISLKAGGFGLNLTEADYVFVLDPWWNPAAENQAVDRAHRIGQENTVMVYRLVSEDTIEEKVVALQGRKRQLFDSVIGDASGLGAPLTADDIRGLLEAD